MNWILNPEEKILWQGRPAPRCYVFMNLSLVLAATVAMVLTGCILWLSPIDMMSMPGLILLLLLIYLCFYGPGRLLYRRWRWESLFYAVTTQRVLVCSSSSSVPEYQLSRLVAANAIPYGDRLASIELVFHDRSSVVLECLEEPQSCLNVLETALKQHSLPRSEP